MIFIGVDSGKSGAIGAIKDDRRIILLEDYPGDVFGCANLIKTIINISARECPVSGFAMGKHIQGAIERAQSMPKQGVRSMFNYGCNYGDWRGCMAMAGIPFEHPTPQMWRKGLITTMGTAKNPSMDAARRLFPEAELYGPRGGARDGRAEALLIAEWLRRLHVAQQPVPIEKPRRKRK
jgi:crossover junction endodeoxyribonuclease RuvC